MNKWDDKDFDERTIREVREEETAYTITYDDGLSFWVDKKYAVVPKVGDTVRSYGQGTGFGVRGIDINGVQLYYQTAQEYSDSQAAEQLARQIEKKASADARRGEMDARLATLPECFQKRIQRFRRNNPDFYWEYEDYEMASCVDAVKIAKACASADEVVTFSKLPYEEQKKIVPDLDAGHSGNTFGMAVRLAHHLLKDERLVFADHAAIAPLVGCECGCQPVTDAEMAEAGYAPL